ncbi:hypothetical protein EZY14_002780 [Kordia sp. TARA_039_SRF]|nr:hypothetical protein EZY14_002780 [Kordia sp. TARA_039_SRF]
MNALLLQTAEVTDLLSVENVSIIGVLLAVIALLIYDRKSTAKLHKIEKETLNAKIKEAQDKLEAEYKNNTEEIKEMVERYYTIASKLLQNLK